MDLYLQIFVSKLCLESKRQIERTDKDAREFSMVSARARIVD